MYDFVAVIAKTPDGRWEATVADRHQAKFAIADAETKGREVVDVVQAREHWSVVIDRSRGPSDRDASPLEF